MGHINGYKIYTFGGCQYLAFGCEENLLEDIFITKRNSNKKIIFTYLYYFRVLVAYVLFGGDRHCVEVLSAFLGWFPVSFLVIKIGVLNLQRCKLRKRM